mmetsp:Transcript_53342/g.113316  ORF Transcript_53342/g.113316 Transcript_53342/m.113316 type:complete len:850 (+) Transcript_53342:82-2631(+)
MADETAAIMLGMGGAAFTNHHDNAASNIHVHGDSDSPPSMDIEEQDDGAGKNQEVAQDGSNGAKMTEDRDARAAAAANDNDDSKAGGDSTPADNMDETKTAANEMPLSTPRRKIKKRREDGFVYAEDTKTKKSASNIKQHPSSATANATKPPRKRPRKCPSKDSILIDVPLSVTADLGVAMRRTRRKRIKRIKEWVASGAAAAPAAAGDESAETNKKSSPKDEDGNDQTGAAGGDKDEKVSGKAGALDEGEYDELEDSDGGPLHRNQYGSMVDYLEAKYVRGVMIEDYDERERVKKKKDSSNNDKIGDAEDSDEREGKGSVYDSDGWIDDSLLHEEVAGQVMASSAYGMTQIEEEARKRKKDKRKREKSTENDGDDKPKTSEGAEIDENDEKSEGDNISDEGSGADSDFDDGFFVNLGDLEMAEGWKDQSEIAISPAKKEAKKKRAYNKKSDVWLKKSEKSKEAKSKTVKKKNVNAKFAAPGAKKKLVKKANEGGGKKEILKKKDGGKAKKSEPRTPDGKPKKSNNKKSKKSEDRPTTPKKKKKKKKATAPVLESATSPDRNQSESAAAEKETTKKLAKSTPAASSDKDPKKEPKAKTPGSTPKEKKKSPEMSKEKEKAVKLRKLYKRRYNACVKMIKEMTSEELPKKQRSKNMMKVSVNIPLDKSIGDIITFGNPNVPGQKLKVKIPKKADMVKRNFVVSVPAPKVTEPELRENNFSKEFKEALYQYANAFDDYCVAEGEHNESLPASKRKPFKPSTEKLKKFEDMLNEFPKNLATPVEVSHLRKVVRQERSNKSRREKRKESGVGDGNAAGGGTVELEEQQQSEILIPRKGTEFSSITYCTLDFDGK